MNTNFLHNINGIYAITPDRALCLDAIEKVVSSRGINILQYRRKTANAKTKFAEAGKLQQLCAKHHTLFIVNDDVNLAQKIQADGVHLGKNDGSIGQARTQLGAHAIIGVSCYNDINLAQKAQQQGADYVAFGALFASRTKVNVPRCNLDIITQARKMLDIPIVGIGGIDFDNQQSAFDAGCNSVAMINTLWEKQLV
ncbi:MAG: thiamine phosphate synthase [Candidatus Thioglobus sp.]|nr:MAG: thiamine phosphate synthase [Candidatus Thioglobus sp.]KAA0456354.1 MAG: thiamine phosphate synthase [Candidatus Thioglobus sp.]